MSPDLHHLDKQAMRAVEGVLTPRSAPNRFTQKEAGSAATLPANPPAGHEAGG